MPRPRAGEWLDDEIIGWQMEGIDTVVSLLELAEISELGLEREAELSREHGIEFISFPIPDRGLPASLPDATTLAQAVALQVREGKAVAIHCRAGIGRSSLIAAGVLSHDCSGCFRLSGCRVGLTPTGKRRLSTAHTRSRHFGFPLAGVARRSATLRRD